MNVTLTRTLPLSWGDDDNKPVIPKIPRPRPGGFDPIPRTPAKPPKRPDMAEQDKRDYDNNRKTPTPSVPERL